MIELCLILITVFSVTYICTDGDEDDDTETGAAE